ncbi:MAG: hypothetical protein IKN27_11535 [Selenomonadaceae bacterium]|nr:hypothetical protein [Selenomonadaceae bacterium]
MTAKEYLQQVYYLNEKIESKLEQIARLQSTATRVTTVITGTPSGGTRLSSRIEEAVAAVQQQSDFLADEIKQLLNLRREVSAAIAELDNHNERLVLEYRYLCFYSWQQIAHVMRTGLRYIYYVHSRALKNFSAMCSKVQ